MAVKNPMGRLKEWLSGRSVPALLLMLVFAFGKFLSASASLCALYAVLFPWALCRVHKMHLDGELVKDGALKWVCAYLGLYVLSALVTMSVGEDWALNVAMVFTASLFMLYVPAGMSVEDMRRDLFRVGCWMVCLYLPFVLLALASVFTGQTFRVPGFGRYVGIQKAGAVAERIQIFTNTNVTARYMALNVLFSIYAICVKKNRWLRAFFGVSIILHFVGLAHTQSRTCLIAFSAAMGVLVFRGICVLLAKRRWRMIAGAAACLLTVLVVLNGMNWIYETDVRMAKARLSGEEVSEESVVTRAEQRGQFDVYSSGRGDIWPPAVKYMMDHPENLILGMGQGNVMKEIGEEYSQVLKYAHLHNSFLSCLVRCGLPFLICVLGFLCTLVRPAWRMLMQPGSEENRGMFMIPVFVIMMLLMAVPEEMLFIKAVYSNLLFYLMCGYVLRFKHMEKGNTNEN